MKTRRLQGRCAKTYLAARDYDTVREVLFWSPHAQKNIDDSFFISVYMWPGMTRSASALMDEFKRRYKEGLFLLEESLDNGRCHKSYKKTLLYAQQHEEDIMTRVQANIETNCQLAATANQLITDFVKQLKTPLGFSREDGARYSDCTLCTKDDLASVTFHNDAKDIRVSLTVSVSQWQRDLELSVSGSTEFLVRDRWFTFDRRGIEDSFYWQQGDEETLEAVIAQQEERVKKARERRERCVQVPGLTKYSMTPEELEEHKATLKKTGTLLLAPSGMGVAHQLYVKRQRYGRFAPQETAEFFGYKQLYMTELDWD